MQKKVLITGGAGFIGANLVRVLLNEGYQVDVLDNLSAGKVEYLSDLDVTLHRVDIRDADALVAAFKAASPDFVYHLAAYGNVVDSVADPTENFSINVQGTFNVLDAARQVSVEKLIFASTGGALMGNTPPPVNEDSNPKPISPYGASKLSGEGYCHAFAHSYDLPVVVCRFANIYGPFSGHKKGVITKYINAIRQGEKEILVFGDGSSERDYLHVSDLCQGLLSALLQDTGRYDTYHLATGIGTSILSLAKICQAMSEGGIEEITIKPKRAGEVEKNFASYDRAQKKLGFSPKVDLKSGLSQLLEDKTLSL